MNRLQSDSRVRYLLLRAACLWFNTNTDYKEQHATSRYLEQFAEHLSNMLIHYQMPSIILLDKN